jgi:hypothetical protein
MLTKPLLSHILDNDALTRGLGDSEARVLVEWLVEQAEHSAALAVTESELAHTITKLCRRGRAIGRFVGLWCHGGARGAAGQLAVAERFTWPLPQPEDEPYEIMQTILQWEGEHAPDSARSFACDLDR